MLVRRYAPICNSILQKAVCNTPPWASNSYPYRKPEWTAWPRCQLSPRLANQCCGAILGCLVDSWLTKLYLELEVGLRCIPETGMIFGFLLQRSKLGLLIHDQVPPQSSLYFHPMSSSLDRLSSDLGVSKLLLAFMQEKLASSTLQEYNNMTGDNNVVDVLDNGGMLPPVPIQDG